VQRECLTQVNRREAHSGVRLLSVADMWRTMLKSDSEIGPVVLGLTPPYLEPGCHEALHEVDLGVLKLESGRADIRQGEHVRGKARDS
jgi:hypothetical protein